MKGKTSWLSSLHLDSSKKRMSGDSFSKVSAKPFWRIARIPLTLKDAIFIIYLSFPVLLSAV